ncbi:hypothetical protein Nepgr_015976 [Nepenthes gracilis]|uniref:RING-type E3 ubiquitin transferase n=1 Tax=Nepenthes gracilis TaxID=150966 RepID=A0AAD3SLU5_NEPGR|nr:hypothetical protein Nepgr_015976 [Nepenthes gracilis]
MLASKGNGGGKAQGIKTVAVAIDKDKSSQFALKWAIDNLAVKGFPVILVHVLCKPSTSSGTSSIGKELLDKQTKELFLSYRCFCTRKHIPCLEITLEDADVAKALTDFAAFNAIEYLVLGLSKGGFIRKFKHLDVSTSTSRGAPDFCTVYVISKGKISSVRNASCPAPFSSPLEKQLQSLVKVKSNAADAFLMQKPRDIMLYNKTMPLRSCDDEEHIKSRRFNEKPFGELSESDTDISFVSSERTSVDRMSMHYEYMDGFGNSPRFSIGLEQNFGSRHLGGHRFSDARSSDSQERGRASFSSHMTGEVEDEVRRLKLELKQTMDLYSTACKEALSAKQKALELQRSKAEGGKKSEAAKITKEAEEVHAEKEKANCRVVMEEEAAERIAKLEAQKRLSEEMKNMKEDSTMMTAAHGVARYRKYTIEEIEAATEFFSQSRKIGEGGYGPVFKCYLDHTQVAVKVLRPDAAQGRSQFQQEVEVLSCIRHPNLVLLLGACPEYGCLVYEYMARGSLEDRLFCQGNTPPLSWQLRFHIAADIATGLHFLHQTKPEPIVHRDLKPANILLDQNFVSKIGDVGLARLVPPSVANSVTQYRMTSTAGTFCYIDPEYQQTGMLSIRSDIYSLGIVLLQLITAKHPMGLAHHVAVAIEGGKFAEILDPAVTDWPVEEALSFAKMAVRCAELRRKDRPDLGKVVLPELAKLRDFADENMMPFMFYAAGVPPSNHSYTSSSQEALSHPMLEHSGTGSSNGQSLMSSPTAGDSQKRDYCSVVESVTPKVFTRDRGCTTRQYISSTQCNSSVYMRNIKLNSR